MGSTRQTLFKNGATNRSLPTSIEKPKCNYPVGQMLAVEDTGLSTLPDDYLGDSRFWTVSPGLKIRV